MIIVSKKENKRARKQNENKVEPHELVSPSQVNQIRKSLIQTHASLVVRGMLDMEVRKELEKIVTREYRMVTKGNKDVIQYIVRETIGTGIIEEILTDESITDIGYNGKELIIETNDHKKVFDTDFKITDEYIVRLVNKFANANNRDFTSKNPIFDGRFENVRINAVHAQNTAPESGTTMSLRVVRPRLALTKDNFPIFAPMFMLDFFEAAVLSHSNMVISGTTGTGKTELHKLISSFVPFHDRIILIEDTPETFMKEMFPEKDIYSWVTNEDVSVTQLIKAGLRNHPVWMMVTETRGSEAYEMIQTVLSGHSIITSLHATNARAIPSRFVNMSKMGYTVDEKSLSNDIRMYFDFGIHIKKVNYKGMVVRYLSEVVQFDPEGEITIFKQRFVDGVFTFETTEIPEKFRLQLEESLVDIEAMNFPNHIKTERPLNPQEVTSFQATIPIDESGRPDLEKLEEWGTTLDEIMGREYKDATYEDELSDDSVNKTKGQNGEFDEPEQSEQTIMGALNEIKERLQDSDKKEKSADVRDNKEGQPRNANLDQDVQRIIQETGVQKKPDVPTTYQAPVRRPRVKTKPKELDDITPDVTDIIEEQRRKLLERE